MKQLVLTLEDDGNDYRVESNGVITANEAMALLFTVASEIADHNGIDFLQMLKRAELAYISYAQGEAQ